MGSYSKNLDLLNHLRTRSQVDCDSLDIARQLQKLPESYYADNEQLLRSWDLS